MDSRDEELTLENVDELVEQYLARPQAFQPPTGTPLTHVVQDLRSIYDEEERLEQVWARINASVAKIDTTKPLEGLAAIPSAQGGKSASSQIYGKMPGIIQHRTGKQVPPPSRRKKWYALAIGLVAAILLITLLTWPMLSYALHNSQNGGAQTPTKPVTQPAISALNMKEYVGQNFKIQCPTDWMIISTNTGNQNSYLQKVQFRPSGTSSVFVNVDAISNTNSSAEQLLVMDPDVKLGTLSSTSSVTYHGLSWTVGVVELAGSSHTQNGQIEIAYSNQSSPYRIEFGATAGMFNSYTKVFNAMLASFYVHTSGPKAAATTVPALTPTVSTPTITPLPASASTPVPSPTSTALLPGIKVYSNLYFTIQYPADWVITSITPGGRYQQTVQFRPSATSPVFVNINVLYSSDLSSSFLLLIDPIVKLGTLLTTHIVTYNGLPWTVGTVNLLASAQEVEIAYSNQNTPYKVEFSAPSAMFSTYTKVFNTMFASFSPTN